MPVASRITTSSFSAVPRMPVAPPSVLAAAATRTEAPKFDTKSSHRKYAVPPSDTGTQPELDGSTHPSSRAHPSTLGAVKGCCLFPGGMLMVGLGMSEPFT